MTRDLLQVDGSLGEGGGQVLRTALALSAVTGRPCEVTNIRAGRPKPGLAPQHRTAVLALAEICEADVQGAELRSCRVVFRPGRVRPGAYRFDVGTAGSTALLLHALYLPLSARAQEESRLTLRGGTHVEWSPTFDYLSSCWVPMAAAAGLRLSVSMARAGYYPEGGGEIAATIAPCEGFRAVDWAERGRLRALRIRSGVANLSAEIARRQAAAAREALRAAKLLVEDVETVEREAAGKGSDLAIVAEYENARAAFTALGRRGRRAEEVGEEAARAFLRHHRSRACLDPRLADQALLPLALAARGSRFTTSAVTDHLRTNAEVLSLFVDLTLRIEERPDGSGLVSVEPAGA